MGAAGSEETGRNKDELRKGATYRIVELLVLTRDLLVKLIQATGEFQVRVFCEKPFVEPKCDGTSVLVNEVGDVADAVSVTGDRECGEFYPTLNPILRTRSRCQFADRQARCLLKPKCEVVEIDLDAVFREGCSVKCRRLQMEFSVGDFVEVLRPIPPGKILDVSCRPLRIGNRADPFKVCVGEIFLVSGAEPGECGAPIDDERLTEPHPLPMTAVPKIGRIIDDSGGDRVEVNVTNDLAKVIVGIDHACAIAALPEAAEIAMTTIVVASDSSLQACH